MLLCWEAWLTRVYFSREFGVPVDLYLYLISISWRLKTTLGPSYTCSLGYIPTELVLEKLNNSAFNAIAANSKISESYGESIKISR